MDNKKNIIIAVVILFIVILGIFIWNNYQIQIVERENKPIVFPPQIFPMCGIENCHGLDIVCGPNIAQMCTMEYRLGDKCRQFAVCAVVNGNCRQIENEQFSECKACVQECEEKYSNNPIDLFACESECGE